MNERAGGGDAMRDLTLVLDHLRNGAIAIERELSAEELELTDDEFRFPAPIAAGLKARLEAGEVRLTGRTCGDH